MDEQNDGLTHARVSLTNQRQARFQRGGGIKILVITGGGELTEKIQCGVLGVLTAISIDQPTNAFCAFVHTADGQLWAGLSKF